VFELVKISYFAYIFGHPVDWPRVVCNASLHIIFLTYALEQQWWRISPAGAVHNRYDQDGRYEHDDADNDGAKTGRDGAANRLEYGLRVKQHYADTGQLLKTH